MRACFLSQRLSLVSPNKNGYNFLFGILRDMFICELLKSVSIYEVMFESPK